MSTSPLRDFLEIPYDTLEEMNLQAQGQRLQPGSGGQDPGRAHEVPDRREADQGGHRVLHRPGRPLPHAGLRQEVPAKSSDNLTFDGSSIRGFAVQAESDLRLAIDWPAFYWMPSDIFGPGKVLVFGLVENQDRTPLRRRHAGPAQGLHRGACTPRTASSATPPTRSRASCSRAWRPSGATTRPAGSSSSAPAATTTACPGTPCACSSTPRPKPSAPWASRTRRTTPRWPPASSR